MKNILTKSLKIVGITAIVGLLAWGGAYLISPKVKEWTNENIFQIEQTVEDETNEDETPGDETTGDETEDGKTEIVPLPGPTPEPVDPEESTEE